MRELSKHSQSVKQEILAVCFASLEKLTRAGTITPQIRTEFCTAYADYALFTLIQEMRGNANGYDYTDTMQLFRHHGPQEMLLRIAHSNRIQKIVMDDILQPYLDMDPSLRKQEHVVESLFENAYTHCKNPMLKEGIVLPPRVTTGLRITLAAAALGALAAVMAYSRNDPQQDANTGKTSQHAEPGQPRR